MRLLVDSQEFMNALGHDVRGARRSVRAQVMSFEGDASGWSLANLLTGADCADRRLMVDAFSRHVLGCRSVHGLWPDAAIRHRIATTNAAHEALRAGGVSVRVLNPCGLFRRRMPARSHKKSIVVDGAVAYLGGINFADHNFAWHDLMLRIEDPAAAAFLDEDLDATWRGRSRAGWARFDCIEIGIVNGVRNPRGFEPVRRLVAGAGQTIIVQTPYLSLPFTDWLGEAAKRGVRVVIVAPDRHPYPAYRRYLQAECTRFGFDLRLLPVMTHVKAMLVDGRRLVLGSSNFDYLSYHLLHEIIAIVDCPKVVRDFERRVLAPDLARSRPAPPRSGGGRNTLRRGLIHSVGSLLRVAASRVRPTVLRHGSRPPHPGGNRPGASEGFGSAGSVLPAIRCVADESPARIRLLVQLDPCPDVAEGHTTAILARP